MQPTTTNSIIIFIVLHWFSYIAASTVIVLLCMLFLNKSSTVFNFNKIFSNGTHGAAFLIAISSMAGVPPFLGFWTKLFLMLFIGRLAGLLLILLCWLLLFLSLFFYINAARFGVSIKQPAPTVHDEHSRPAAVLFIAVVLLLFGVFFINDFLLFIGLLLI